MIDVSFAIAERLVERVRDAFQFVGSLADFTALEDVPRSVPAAYVIPLDEQAGTPDTIGSSTQMHAATVGVVIVVRYAGDATGSRATLALSNLRERVHQQLVGWTPPQCHAPIAFLRGSLADPPEGGVVIWRDEFTVGRIVQRPIQQT